MTLSRRQIWYGVLAVVLIPIAAPFVSLQSARQRILRTLSADLGRSVRADAVHLRLFPLPGVELDQVRLADAPAFGIEDMVIADSASASVQLGPLLTGRLVFARLELDHPSINLVRNAAGEWNIAALLDAPRPAAPAAKLAPTEAARAPVPAPLGRRFPYVEWSDGRINFKLGQSKTRLYLGQVSGSLARAGDNWRLQAQFQPLRTDVNLSNTGDVRIDGRWAGRWAASGNRDFRQLPFDLVLRVSNSYLAGSSALVLGHDAGVHGILGAQVHVQGTGAEFSISGTLSAQSLRRWDMLPPPASVQTSFLADYFPAQDHFELQGLGDPGWRHIRLSGSVDRLFSQPQADLKLSLNQFAAADLLPLVLAVKAHLPANLAATGSADGDATLHWRSNLSGAGHFQLHQIRLATAGNEISLPVAQVVWDERGVHLLPARLAIAPQGPTSNVDDSVELAASVDTHGFALQLDSRSLSAASAQALSQLCGIASPLPPGLIGSAQARLTIAAPWNSFRQAGWQGDARFLRARYQPGAEDLALTDVSVGLSPLRPPRVQFVHTPFQGWAAFPVNQPPEFHITARRLAAADVWDYLHPPPADFVQRLFGGGTPAWISQLNARGSIVVSDLDWRGFHAAVGADLVATPDHWRAPRLSVSLANGVFTGSARLDGSQYTVSGVVPPSQPLNLRLLLAPTKFGNAMSGAASGTVELSRAAGAAGFDQTTASGHFEIRHGQIATSTGMVPFDLFAADYHLEGGVAALDNIQWLRGGALWRGNGSAQFQTQSLDQFDLQLSNGGATLDLQNGNLPPSIARIVAYAHAPPPYHDVTVSAEAVNQYWAGAGKSTLPAAVSHLKLGAEPGWLTGSAEIDFDRLRQTGSHSPLLQLFTGKHTVSARARLDSGAAPEAHLTITEVRLDGEVVPNFLIDAAVAAFIRPRYPKLGRSFAVALPAHCTAVTLANDAAVFHYQ
ncbi:MAG TPA: AsmA family protein [Terriglobales bacterium]|nr:AsmA family protein [Terriglobales bacterium]